MVSELAANDLVESLLPCTTFMILNKKKQLFLLLSLCRRVLGTLQETNHDFFYLLLFIFLFSSLKYFTMLNDIEDKLIV